MEPLFEELKKKAIGNKKKIILPESTEPRTLAAADRIIADSIADIILIGNAEEIKAKAEELKLNNISKATIVNPDDAEHTEKYAQLFYELRKSKGITIDDARKKVKDPLYLGCLMINWMSPRSYFMVIIK